MVCLYNEILLLRTEINSPRWEMWVSDGWRGREGETYWRVKSGLWYMYHMRERRALLYIIRNTGMTGRCRWNRRWSIIISDVARLGSVSEWRGTVAAVLCFDRPDWSVGACSILPTSAKEVKFLSDISLQRGNELFSNTVRWIGPNIGEMIVASFFQIHVFFSTNITKIDMRSFVGPSAALVATPRLMTVWHYRLNAIFEASTIRRLPGHNTSSERRLLVSLSSKLPESHFLSFFLSLSSFCINHAVLRSLKPHLFSTTRSSECDILRA